MRTIGINFRKSLWCDVIVEVFWYCGAYGFLVYITPKLKIKKGFKKDHTFITDPLLFIGVIIKK